MYVYDLFLIPGLYVKMTLVCWTRAWVVEWCCASDFWKGLFPWSSLTHEGLNFFQIRKYIRNIFNSMASCHFNVGRLDTAHRSWQDLLEQKGTITPGTGGIFFCDSWCPFQEKNVFILEGTKAAGFSGCCYGGSPDERRLLMEGIYTLTAEVKSVPSEQTLRSAVMTGGFQNQVVLLKIICHELVWDHNGFQRKKQPLMKSIHSGNHLNMFGQLGRATPLQIPILEVVFWIVLGSWSQSSMIQDSLFCSMATQDQTSVLQVIWRVTSPMIFCVWMMWVNVISTCSIQPYNILKPV